MGRLAAACLCVALAGCCTPDGYWFFIKPEQRQIEVQDPSQLPKAHIPDIPAPATVSSPRQNEVLRDLTLDEAIRIALENSTVVRVLAGVSAVPSGRTIYDPAIVNTTIDEERARFDPRLEITSTFTRSDQPGAGETDLNNLNLGLAKTNVTGGTADLNVNDNHSPAGDNSSVRLGYAQPLLRGAGIAANVAPIVIARINTERSFFQFKDSVQELVRGVIAAYWNVVLARTNVWARQQQVDQGKAAYERADARKRRGFGTAADVAQARVALSNFEASLITAQADLLQREAALRNIMGLLPIKPELVPVTPPAQARLEFIWDEIIKLAEERRPDLIELKLIIEADEQLLLEARNQALPQLDGIARYQWNGLEGETQTNDWTLGVNFSVPLGLRQARANLRNRELLIERDRANLDQGLFGATHTLAEVTRNLDQYYEQYEAYRSTRDAARINLDQQFAEFRAGRAIFLDVLQAITAWGDAVSREALALTQYNTELANLERETGTILDTHGVTFSEERFGSIGPLGRLQRLRCYPSSVVPNPNTPRYPAISAPAEESLDLKNPVQLHGIESELEGEGFD